MNSATAMKPATARFFDALKGPLAACFGLLGVCVSVTAFAVICLGLMLVCQTVGNPPFRLFRSSAR